MNVKASIDLPKDCLDIVGRNYCIKHPARIIQLFGLGVWFGMLFSRGASLLDHVVQAHSRYHFPMPGYLGAAYRISALIEFRVARIYQRMADKFHQPPAVREFFLELQAEEQEHGRLMMLCLYTARLRPSVTYIPRISDPEIRVLLRRLRGIDRSIDQLTLDRALDLVEELEGGEINVIFDRLLKQTPGFESHFFAEQMQAIEGHGQAVPRRISKLRESLEPAES